jgi:CDP-diacylglycerol--serine O-phosphatidyltransferase
VSAEDEFDGRPGRRPTRRPRRILRLSTIPTAFTLGNLVCGFLAIAYLADAQSLYSSDAAIAAGERVVMAGWMILGGMVFDALDGGVARLTHTASDFGGELDSLADMVTFGVAPALTAKVLIQKAFGSEFAELAFLTASFYAVCAALRLARYNAEHEEATQPTTSFKGLPTPGAAGVLASFAVAHPFFLERFDPEPFGKSVGAHVLGFGVLTGLGMLMVSNVPFPHAANRLLRGRRSVGRISLMMAALMALFYFVKPPQLVFVAAFSLYALSNMRVVTLNHEFKPQY